MKPELKRQIGLIMDRHPVFSTALIARRCFASKSASNEYHFGRPGIPVTLRELEEKMMRDVLSDDHFKHMAKVMVERMVSSVKGEFNNEAKTVKTEVEKLLKSSEKSRESTAAASTSSVNNASAAVPAQRNKRGSNKENDESKEGPVNTKTAEQPQKKPARGGKRGQSKKAAEKTEEVKAEVKTEVKEEVKAEVKPAEKAKRGAPAAKKAKKAEIVQEKPVAAVKQETDKPVVTAAPVGAPFPAPTAPKRISRRGGVEAAEQQEVKTEAKPEVKPVEKAKKAPAAKRAKKVDTDAKVSPKTDPAIVVPAAQADQKSPVDNKPKEDTLAPTPPAPTAKAPAVVKSTGAGRKRKNATATAPEKETLAPAGIIEKVVVSPTKAPATVVKPVEKPGRKRKNATALAPVISNAKVQKIVAAAGPATVVKAATAKGPTGPIIGSTAPLAKIITGSPGSPSRIAITGNNLVSLSSLTQPLPPQVVLPTTPLPAGPAQVQSVKSSPPPPQVIQLRPAGTSFSHGSTGSNPMQIRPLRAAGVGIGGAGGPRPQFFKIVGGKPVQISNLQRLPAGSTVSALQQAPAGSRVVYMRAPAPGAGSSAAPGSQAASVVVTSSSASPTSSATAAAGGAATASGGPPGATAVSGTGNKIILLSNKGQAIPVSGKGGVGGGPSIVRIVSPNSLTTTSGGKLALAPNSPTKVLRPAGGATGPILLRTVAPRPGNSTAAPPIQLPMAPLPKSALTNNPNSAGGGGGGGSVVTVSAAGDKSAVKIMSQTEAATAKAIQVLLPKNPLPPTGSNIVGATTTTTGPTSPQKSGSGLAMTTTTTTTTASGAFVWTNSTRANFKLSSRINFASLDKFKNVVNKDVHFILASIVTEDKSNEFSFRLHLKREPVSKAKKASGELSQPIQQQSYLELEGKAKVPTAQEWSLKVKTEPPVFLVSKGTFLSDFPAVRIPKEIAEKPFVDYELHIDKCSPMQVASTTTAAATPSASATPRPATTAAPAAAAPPPAPTSGAASKPTGNTGGGTSALPGKRVRKPKVQS